MINELESQGENDRRHTEVDRLVVGGSGGAVGERESGVYVLLGQSSTADELVTGRDLIF